MSELTMKLQKLRKAYAEIECKNRPPQFVWQVIHRDSDFFQSITDFDPVDYHRRSVKESLPDDEETLIDQINRGLILLLGGILRLIVVPDEIALEDVEVLMDALQRKYGTKRAAMYEKAVELIYNERK